MRIVITKLGKNEIKEVDYEEIPYNNFTQKNKNNKRTISYNKIPKNISIDDSGEIFKKRINNSIHHKIEHNQLPPINKSIKTINTTFTGKNNKTSFLSKIGELSVSPQEFRTPHKTKKYLELNQNNINVLPIQNKNENKFINTNSNNFENVFKKIKINPKKLNIPLAMLDKYSKDFFGKSENDIFKKVDESKINNTENSLTLDKNKFYSLREILLPKNQKNIDESFLDKKINSNGGESIINYLQSDKDISRSLIEKINKSNNEQLYKLDKVCQKYFNDEKLKFSLDNEIKQKIKKEYELDSIYCKNNLNDMNVNLKNYNTIYRRLRLKKENYENFKNLYLAHKK